MQSQGGAVFGSGVLARPADFVDPLDTFFGELIAEGVAPDQFDQAVKASQVQEEWDRERNSALAAIFRAVRRGHRQPARRPGATAATICSTWRTPSVRATQVSQRDSRAGVSSASSVSPTSGADGDSPSGDAGIGGVQCDHDLRPR